MLKNYFIIATRHLVRHKFFSVINILSTSGDAKDNDYFIQLFKKYPGWQTYYFLTYYEAFLKNMTDFYVIQKGIDQIKFSTMNGTEWWISFFGSGTLSDLKSYYDDAAYAVS